MNQELFDYVKQQVEKGTSKEEILSNLKKAGWNEKDINEALERINNPSVPSPKTAALPGPIELLAQSWKVFTKRVWTLLGISLVPVLAAIPVYLILFAIFGAGIALFRASAESPKIPNFSPAVMIIGGVVILALFIGLAILGIWSQATLIVAVRDSEEKIGIKESFKRAWPKARSFWWVTILMGAIMLGGALFFLIPAFIFSIWFAFSQYVVMSEDQKGLNALLKSREYVRGKWWAVFGRLFFLGIIFYIISLIPQMLVSSTKNSVWLIIFSLISIVISIITPYLSVIYSFNLFKSLKTLKGENLNSSNGTKNWVLILTFLGYIIMGLLIYKSTSLFSQTPAKLYNYDNILKVTPPVSTDILTNIPTMPPLYIEQ